MGLLEFVGNNGQFLGALVVAVVSELMALNPNWKYNGILHAVLGVVRKKK